MAKHIEKIFIEFFFAVEPRDRHALTDDDDENENVAGTDDDVPPPDGENYFGRAAKEGAAPEGANPFAMPAPAADDDDAR